MNPLGLRHTLIFINCFVAIRERRSVLNSLIIFTSVEKTVKRGSFFHSSHSNKRMYILPIKWKAELTRSWVELCVMKCFWADLLAWRSSAQTVSVRNNVTDHQRDFTAPQHSRPEKPSAESVNALARAQTERHSLLSLTQIVHKRGPFHNPQFSTETRDKLP